MRSATLSAELSGETSETCKFSETGRSSISGVSGRGEEEVTSTVQAVITAAADVLTDILVAVAWLMVCAVMELTADEKAVPDVKLTVFNAL